MDIKEIAELAITASVGLAWPLIAGTAILVFRRPVITLLEKLESAKGGGIEATFFRSAMIDPQSSDETKDEIAAVWKSIAQAKGQAVPVEAEIQLGMKAAKRGRPASAEVARTVAERTYVEEVKAALARIGVPQDQFRTSSTAMGTLRRPDGYPIYCTFSVQPLHGVGEVDFWVQEDIDASMRSVLADHAGSSQGLKPTQELVVISNDGDAISGLLVCRWANSDDDEKLASIVESAGVFDYIEESISRLPQ